MNITVSLYHLNVLIIYKYMYVMAMNEVNELDFLKNLLFFFLNAVLVLPLQIVQSSGFGDGVTSLGTKGSSKVAHLNTEGDT